MDPLPVPPPVCNKKDCEKILKQLPLPEDVTKLMYNSHLAFDIEKKPLCDAFLQWLNHSEEAKTLRPTSEIYQLNDQLLLSKDCVAYLRKHDSTINLCYEEHFIRRKKTFVLMNVNESFMVSILMYKYH